MKDHIRIASGQGFWGDLLSAPKVQVTGGPVDYLVMDYLAEVTMSIMQKQKRRDPKMGYAKDLIPLIADILPDCVEKGVKIITNGGGVNPQACAEAILENARNLGIRDLKIGIVTGDDLIGRLDALRARGIDFKNMETGEEFDDIADRISSANVYFGAFPIVEALQREADIVITGRTTDTGLTLAPMIHEFGWEKDDWDKLAAGTVAGHIMECGGQATGGNFSADWKAVPELEHIGFPITEAYPDGTIVITKHDGTGGLVTQQTVKEQLLYEIGDPTNYITPETVADFTTIRLSDDGRDRVTMTGVKGKPCTDSYKVSMSYSDGYTAVSTLTYTWPDALEKAQAADRILRKRLADLGLQFDEIRTEYVGVNACHAHLVPVSKDVNEVVLRVGVRGKDHAAIERFGKEIAPLILTGPPSVTGFAGGRPKPSEVIAYWPALITKDAVQPEVMIATL
jgi:hypothetical protein